MGFDFEGARGRRAVRFGMSVAFAAAAAVPTYVLASQVGTLVGFRPGDAIRAADFNANFRALASAIDDNDRRIGSLGQLQTQNRGDLVSALNEVRLGVTGPQGPQGPTGPQGPQGPQGIQGPAASVVVDGSTITGTGAAASPLTVASVPASVVSGQVADSAKLGGVAASSYLQSVTTGSGFSGSGTAADPLLFDTGTTDSRYLKLSGGTMTGAITGSGGSTGNSGSIGLTVGGGSGGGGGGAQAGNGATGLVVTGGGGGGTSGFAIGGAGGTGATITAGSGGSGGTPGKGGAGLIVTAGGGGGANGTDGGSGGAGATITAGSGVSAGRGGDGGVGLTVTAGTGGDGSSLAGGSGGDGLIVKAGSAGKTTFPATTALAGNAISAVAGNGTSTSSAASGTNGGAGGIGLTVTGGNGGDGASSAASGSGGDAVYAVPGKAGTAGSGGTTGSDGYAGNFQGNVQVTGTLSKGSGTFKIDHPLDPENRFLYHSFVESPDMKNVYDGVVVLDARGEATVELPSYFEALNRDFRYQLTCVGGFAPVHVASEVRENRFRIAGGSSGLKVSWQVTGIRKDPFANAHRVIPEVEKSPEERGRLLHPKERGEPESRGIDYERVRRARGESAPESVRDPLSVDPRLEARRDRSSS